MFPVLFSFDLGSGPTNIHSYGVLIAIGAIIAYIFTQYQAKKQLGIPSERIQALARIIIIGAFVGGKFFFYLEDPTFYFSSPEHLTKNFRNGFVFYGSLITVLPMLIWYFRKHRLPVWPMLDIMAFVALILHSFGRMGCFLAGCCYGKPTEGFIFVTYHDHLGAAPTDVHLHPTQLYSITLLVCIFVILWMFKRYKRFEGQLFMLYIMIYATGRAVIEMYRGDIRRGFLIEDWLSHSQGISIVLIAIVAFFYVRRLKTIKSEL